MIQVGVVSRDNALADLVERAVREWRRTQPLVRCRVTVEPTLEAMGVRVGSQTLHAVFVDPSHAVSPNKRSSLHQVPEAVHAFVSRHPIVPIVIWADHAWFHHRRILLLGNIGVREVLVRGVDDRPEQVCGLLAGLLETRRVQLFRRALPRHVPEEIVHLLETTVMPSWSPPSVTAMAEALFCDRTTLYRRFRAAGLPSPRELRGWVRAYLVLSLHEEGFSLERAAMECGFRSVPAFLRTARRWTRVSEQSTLVKMGSEGILTRLSCVLRKDAP